MEISGKIIRINPPQTGQGRNGEWKKQEFVIQTEGPYPKSVCFTVWNNKIDLDTHVENQSVKVSFDPESREFNGRWYTDLIAWRIAKENEVSSNTTEQNEPTFAGQPDAIPDDTTDDLPF
jgi:hypothetical protein